MGRGKVYDYKGIRFGRLTCIREVPPLVYKGKTANYTKRQYLCECMCGTQKVVQLGLMKSGETKSCGCIRKRRLIPENKIK